MEKITIGTDPEFIFERAGSFIPAPSVFTPKGDPYTAHFGYDGHCSTAELRVKPATDPLQLAKNPARPLLDSLIKSSLTESKGFLETNPSIKTLPIKYIYGNK